MKADETFFQEFIKKDIQMFIPIYQREYSWQKEQWKELLEDIVDIGSDETRKSYFIGSVVYKAEYMGTSATKLDIIDGQQRITTLTLLLCALLKFWNDINDETKHNITQLLINNDFKKSRKLYLRSRDDVTLEKIIDYVIQEKEWIDEEKDSLNIKNAFNYFKNELNSSNSKIIWNGVCKLIFIEVILDSDDKTQLIFESLNSTGKALSNSDLIRNYVLMGADNQELLYNKYWSIIETRFANVNEIEFDEFIRNYLMVKLEKNVTIPNVYKDFKHFKNLKYDDDIEGLVKNISKYSKYYINMVYGYEEDSDLKKAFDSLKELEYGVVYRFLLNVYDDYLESMKVDSNINLSKEDFIQIVKYLESYVLRRYICSLDPNTMNNFFLTLHKNIDVNNYLNSFIANFLQYNETSPRRFPSDEEFGESLKTRKVYNKKTIVTHLLYTLERSLSKKEVLDFEGIEIEHIMPQSLSEEWKKELGENFREIHEIYLHTIGNLTLTGYNPEMSNKSFIDKKLDDFGLDKSKVTLNDYFENIDTWNEKEIIKRANELFKYIKDLWQCPLLTDEIKEIILQKNEIKQNIEYTEEDLFNIGEEDERTQAKILYNQLSPSIFSIDERISVKFNKYYLAFKLNKKNVIKASPQKQGLKLSMAINYDEIDDPKEFCERGKGSFPTVLILKNKDDIWYVLNLIKQVFKLN